MGCTDCTADRQARLGCAPGTTAEHPFQVGPLKLDRCPLALCREIPPDDDAWISWGTRWANAKAEGGLAHLLPDPSAYALEIIHAVEQEWAAQRKEESTRREQEAEAERRRLQGGR